LTWSEGHFFSPWVVAGTKAPAMRGTAGSKKPGARPGRALNADLLIALFYTDLATLRQEQNTNCR
jgi:hypothetical protein